MNEPTSPKRISLLAAVAFAIAWIPLLCIPAFVLALMARREIRDHQQTLRGKALTTAGMALAAMTPIALLLMNIAYRKNLENHRWDLMSARAALEGQQTNSFLRGLPGSREETRRLMEHIQRMESNPPSFLNPYGW